MRLKGNLSENLLTFLFIFWELWKAQGSYKIVQDSTITIKSPYVITHVCQNFSVRDLGKHQTSIYYAFYILAIDFPNNFA